MQDCGPVGQAMILSGERNGVAKMHFKFECLVPHWYPCTTGRVIFSDNVKKISSIRSVDFVLTLTEEVYYISGFSLNCIQRA
jgi:hypothetical protein